MVWEKFWEKFKGSCWGSGLTLDQGAILLKLLAPDHSQIHQATRHLKIEDDTLQKATYEQIYELIKGWCGPDKDIIISESRKLVEGWRRRLGDRDAGP